MRRPDDSGPLEAELRLTLRRRPAPFGLSAQVMERVRAEPERPAAALRKLCARWLQFRMAWPALAAGAALVLVAVAVPLWQRHRAARGAAPPVAERELAEVLQLAGQSWNRAQAAAFAPKQEKQFDD